MKCECGRAFQPLVNFSSSSRLLRGTTHRRTIIFLAWFAVTCSVSFPVRPSIRETSASLRPYFEEADEDIALRPGENPYEQTQRVIPSNFDEDEILLVPGQNPYERDSISSSPHRSRSADYSSKRSVQSEEDPVNNHGVWCEKETADGEPKDGIVPWKYHSSLSGRTAQRVTIRQAMDLIEAHTCVKFVPYDPDFHVNYIDLEYTSSECTSFVGMIGGEQPVKISPQCERMGNVVHELGHVLGLWHEQSRRDRDQYIRIIEENIKDGKKNNFDRLTEYQMQFLPNVSYDLCSIMHYGEYAFAKDPTKPTIEVLNTTEFSCKNNLSLGQREELSEKDKLKINLLYSCKAHLATPTPTPDPVANATEQPEVVINTTTTELPTPTMKPPKKRTKITHNLTILLQLQQGSNTDYIECDSRQGRDDCSLEHCSDAQLQAAGCDTNQRLQILLPSLKNKIKSGDDIVLRSTRRLGMYIDCHGSACELTRCYNNNGDPNSNSSTFVSDCENHVFKVIAMNRPEDKTLREGDTVVLQNSTEGSYLHCSSSKCTTQAPSCSEEGSEETERYCGVQRFKIVIPSANH